MMQNRHHQHCYLMFDHEELQIWQRSNALAAAIHAEVSTRRRGCTATPALKTQLLRACISILANIAECAGQDTGPQSARFIDITIGSISETQSHLSLAAATGLISHDKALEFQRELRELRAMCCAFKRWLLRSSP